MPKVIYKGGATLVAFDADWAAGISEKLFVKHEAHHGLTADQLKEAHSLCKAAVKAPAEVPAEEPVPVEDTTT
jgi:hypothetical protein